MFRVIKPKIETTISNPMAVSNEFNDGKCIEEILKLLLNPMCNIHEYDANDRCIILITYDLSSKSYFEMLVKEFSPKLDINNEIIQKLLLSIVSNNDYASLFLVLNKCITENCDNDFMVKLATESLKGGNNDLINVIFLFTSKTTLLKNGETFMTNLFKENIDEAIIKKVIEMKHFDLNVPNAIEETALTLACDRLMADTVQCLLNYGSDASYQNHIALEKTIFAKSNNPYKEKEANTIKNLLINSKNSHLNATYYSDYCNYCGDRYCKQAGHRRLCYQQLTRQIDYTTENNDRMVLNIMRLLLTNHGDLMKVNVSGQCALYMAYSMIDKRFYKMFIENCRKKIDFLGTHQGLAVLEKIIDDRQMETLKSSLALAIIDQKYDRDLLALALRMIVKGMNNQYTFLVELCSNVNIVMKNNETFLTGLFKNNISSDTIINIILSNKFNVNISNGINETPLMLACERLLPDVVDLLLRSGADLSRLSYKAVDLLVTNTTYIKDPQKRNVEKTRIMDLITKKDMPFKSKTISVKKRIFECLDVNSKVIYYDHNSDNLVPLYGTVRWSGVDKEKVPMYGIELDESCEKATDGKFKNMQLFNCKPLHGLIVPIEEVAPDPRFFDIVIDDEIPKESEISTVLNCGIPRLYLSGDNVGIQCQSCDGFVESIIYSNFSKSFVLDFYLSPNQDEVIDIVGKFKNVLSWSIVYPLREFGFVSFHKIKLLKDIFIEIYENQDINLKENSELEKFTEVLLKLCPTEPLLRYVSFNNDFSSAMFLRLGFTSSLTIDKLSSQNLLEITMAERAIMFSKIPGCLMLELPADVRKTLNCSQIIPLGTINISPLLSQSFRQCFQCETEASIQCLECVKAFMFISQGLFCDIHKCTHKDATKLPQFNCNTKSHCIMDLKAIICWNIDHYLAYVKEVGFINNWLCFDCCSKKDPTNNCSVPTVAMNDNVMNFLNQNMHDIMIDEVNRFVDQDVECLLKNARILVYESAIVNCY